MHIKQLARSQKVLHLNVPADRIVVTLFELEPDVTGDDLVVLVVLLEYLL